MSAAEGSLITLAVVFVAAPIALLGLGLMANAAAQSVTPTTPITPASPSATGGMSAMVRRRRRGRGIGALHEEVPFIVGPGVDGCGQVWDVFGNPIWTDGISAADYSPDVPRQNPYGPPARLLSRPWRNYP